MPGNHTELFLKIEQAAFAGQELAPVERDDRAEFGVGSLSPALPELIWETVKSDCLADVGFLGILRALKGHRALESLSVQPLGEANLPCIAFRLANLPDATLLIL